MEAMRKVEVLRAACCVAGIDGFTSLDERQILDRLAREIGVGEASLTAMIERAEKDKSFYQEQFDVLKAAPKETMQLLLQLAIVDGLIQNDEVAVLRGLGGKLNVNADQFDAWLQQAVDYLAGERLS